MANSLPGILGKGVARVQSEKTLKTQIWRSEFSVVIRGIYMERPEITYLVNDDQWELTESFYVKRMRGIIEKGFRFDLASIPRFFWRFMAPYELSIEGPLAHDYLYRFGGVYYDVYGVRHDLSREEVDNLFLQIMTDEGVGWFRRNAAYRAVRMFAGFAWKNPRVNMLGGDK